MASGLKAAADGNKNAVAHKLSLSDIDLLTIYVKPQIVHEV